MKKNIHEQSLLQSISPSLLRQYIVFDDVNKLHLTEKDRNRAIEEMDIHIENVRKNGGDIVGYSLLRKNLESSSDKNIYILSGHDRKYGFDLYLDRTKSHSIGVAIIRLRRKSEEELKWEREVLGIKHP